MYHSDRDTLKSGAVARASVGDLFKRAAEGGVLQVSETASHGGGKNSTTFSIVNSAVKRRAAGKDGNNGMRVTFSKSVADWIGVTDKAYIAPMPDDSVILLAAEFPPAIPATRMQLRADSDRMDKDTDKVMNSGKKICYNAALVTTLTDAFSLDFTARTSMSFSDIDLTEYESTKVAIVQMPISQTDVSEGEATA